MMNDADRCYPIELGIEDTTDAVKSTSYRDISIFMQQHHSTACIWNFYICQLVRYNRANVTYHDFRDRGSLLTRKIFIQQFRLVKLKSSLRFLNAITNWLIVSELTTDLFRSSSYFSSPIVTYRMRLSPRLHLKSLPVFGRGSWCSVLSCYVVVYFTVACLLISLLLWWRCQVKFDLWIIITTLVFSLYCYEIYDT